MIKYIVACGIFLLLDSIWIKFFALPLYERTLFELMANRSNLEMVVAAGACYALLLLGLCWFVLPSSQPILNGFLFGLVVYGVFALTNYIVFEAWTVALTLSDGIWGGVLYALTAAIVSLIFV
ncbi:DUF2177 family protein [Gammaproteobacteria bacterium]|nr:DUF2177 family protein [Gammaproteobacteria bacterium]